MKNIMIFLTLVTVLCLFSGCKEVDDVDNSIELASPKPVAKTKLATVTVTWPAIPKTAGYAYRVGESGEFTIIEASKTSVTISALAKGDHNFYIYAAGDLDHTNDSKVRQIAFSIDPNLPKPSPSYEMTETAGEVVLKWAAVEGAVGYAYRFSETEEWINVADDVLTITKRGLDTDNATSFYIYAVGENPDAFDSEVSQLDFRLIDTSKGVWVRQANGTLTELESTVTNKYGGTITCAASDSFEVLIEGVVYGFAEFTGNGGIGTVNSVKASVPFYNNKTNESIYYVRESVGQMSSVTPLNEFWINMAAAGSFAITVDLTNADSTPRYYMKWIAVTDPKVVLEQYFDLFSYGGNWVSGLSGTAAPATSTSVPCDGTEPGTSKTGTGTALGKTIVSNTESNPAYITNRGIQGWALENCYEFPGIIRLSNSKSGANNLYGAMTTPKLVALTQATEITLTFDALRFASVGDVAVNVTGAGTVTAASVKIEGIGSDVALGSSNGGKTITIIAAHTPKHANAIINKPWSNYTVTITGATADTQINWDCSSADTSNEGRICFDNIVIVKN